MSAVEDPEDGIVVSKPTVRRLVLEHFAHHERFCSAPVGLQNETMRWLARYRATLPSALLIERLADPETFAAAAAIVGKRQRREAEVLVRETLELYAEDSAMGIAAIGAYGGDAEALASGVRDESRATASNAGLLGSTRRLQAY